MISVEGVEKPTIRSHYQLGTVFYRLLWGEHVHHGLWSADESPSLAQRQLIDALADLAGLREGSEVLDVGCGMGGSAIRLAKDRGCKVTGVTLSPVQRRWAAISSKLRMVGADTRFHELDAELMSWPGQSFDVIWSIECTEHLFDKAGFITRAAEWLRPGGRMALGVWFEGQDTRRPGHRELVEDVCHRFICPSLGTRNDYASWMRQAGLQVIASTDWTRQAEKTWEICKQRVERFKIRSIASLLDRHQVDFLDGFDTILQAYRCGAMQYGAIVAEKPLPVHGGSSPARRDPP